jgi:DNA-binding NarL/FixJ family response regulator
MKKPRLLLADDHRIVLEGLRGMLEPEFEIVGAVADGCSMVAEARRLTPDVVVADISMPGLNGIEAARQIHAADERIRVVFLTMHADAGYAAGVVEAGASGFVLKHSAPQELIRAIREALQGRTYVTPAIAGELKGAQRQGAHRPGEPAAGLSPRQREVLQLLAEGKSTKEVAALLNISARTAEFHKYRMMEQLRIKTTAELVQYAIKHGLLTV